MDNLKNEIAVNATFQNENETVENRVEFEIQKFNIVDAELAELKKKFKNLKIAGVDDKKGIKAVNEAISIVRGLRTSVETKRTDLKSFYFETGKGIDAEAKRIQSLIADIEEPLKAKKTAIEDEKKRQEEEKARMEQERVDGRVEALKTAGIVFDGTFYSIGENVSVDLATIETMEDDAFEKLCSVVAGEKEKIDNQVRLQKVHEDRKEAILPFWSFLTSEMQQSNFADISEGRFKEILHEVEAMKNKFDQDQLNQKKEAEKQIQERKDLNFEKRSFRFEKEGFDVNEDGVSFVNEIGNVIMSRKQIEELNNPEFEQAFTLKIGIKKAFEKEFLQLAEQRKKDAEQKAIFDAEGKKAQSRMKVLNLIEGHDIEDTVFFSYADNRIAYNDLIDLTDEEFLTKVLDIKKEISEYDAKRAKEQEEERLALIPEIEKAKEFIRSFLDAECQPFESTEINELIQDFKLKINVVSEQFLSNLKNL